MIKNVKKERRKNMNINYQ